MRLFSNTPKTSPELVRHSLVNHFYNHCSKYWGQYFMVDTNMVDT